MAGLYPRPGKGRRGGEEDPKGLPTSICYKIIYCATIIPPLWCFFYLKEQTRRSERKNRDEFRKLMEGHVAPGILTAKTHWQDYCSKVTRYIFFQPLN